MSEQEVETTRAARRRRNWIIAAVSGAVVVAIVVVLIAVNVQGSPTDARSSGSPTPSVTASPTSKPSPEPSTSSSGVPEPTDAPVARETAAPVPLDESQDPIAGLSVSLTSIEAVTGEVVLPGEVAGPALRVTVEARNSTGAVVETPAVVVNLYYGPDRIAGNPFLQPGGKPFPASIASGESATGIYVFDVPEDQRDDILIEVDMLFDSSVVLFEGAFSG